MKPDFKQAQALVREGYPKAVEAHVDKVIEAKATTGQFRWDRVVSEYNALVSLNQAIKSLPTLTEPDTKATARFDVQDYTEALAEAKSNAAEEHYQAGRSLFGRRE